MLSTEIGHHLSSPEDPFEDDTLFSLMPNSFKGLISHNPSDPLSTEQALDRLLSQLALKKTAKDTEQANAILTSIPNLDTSGINVDTAFFCKHKIEQPEDIKEMAQEPALYKENIQPNENIPKSRIRREGTGRVSSRRPFTINLSSFGSNLNIQKDPINIQKDPIDVEDVDEFFAAVERQETADAILRKWRGEKSPVAVCSQLSRKTRVRRQGTGRKTKSKNFDLELLGDAEKYMQLDGEKLLVEEEEDPISTFSSGAKQACEMLIETGDRKTIKVLSTQESGHEECLSETVNGELQYQRDVRLDSDWKNCIQAHDQHSMAHVGDVDGLQVNPVQEKETLRGSETEETVNMPPKELFSTEYSAKSALHQLIKDYMKQDAVNTNPAPCSLSGLDINDIEKSYPKDLDCDTQYALQQSQTESSNTIHSQSLFTDEVKMIIQPQQFPKNFRLAGFDRTPSENFCQKPTEISSPLTSPTPPSKISAAFKSRRKHKSGIEGKIEDVCKPPLEKKDEEEAKVHASSPSYISRRLQTSSPSHISRGLHASSPSDISRKFHISSPSHISRKLHTSSPLHISKKLHTSSPSHISGKLCSSNPLKKGECSGLRRLIFEISPRSPKQDEFNSVESLNDAEATDLVNPSKVYEENDRVDTVTTDVDLSNVAVLRPEKNTPVNSTEPPDFNVLVSETEKNVLGSASGEQIEEFPVTLHKKNVKKAKRQLKNNTNSSVCDAHVENEIISNEIESKKRKYRKCDFQRRQSLTGAGTLWKSGVRRSQRIRSRPLEYWRGERFLFGRIHHSLRTVIGIKYTSPVHAQKNKHDFPDFKVKSYVDDQYSHLVEFAALH